MQISIVFFSLTILHKFPSSSSIIYKIFFLFFIGLDKAEYSLNTVNICLIFFYNIDSSLPCKWVPEITTGFKISLPFTPHKEENEQEKCKKIFFFMLHWIPHRLDSRNAISVFNIIILVTSVATKLCKKMDLFFSLYLLE